MLRKLISLLLALALCTGAASAAVLPAETRTYPEADLGNGVRQLQWGGPDLPAQTEYELLQTVITDTTCTLGPCTEPFHKFAQIAYTDADGQRQTTWVMAYSLNRALEGDYAPEEAARAYAQRFFSNQYILAAQPDAPLILTPIQDGWQAELQNASGAATHRLAFTHSGAILHYQDLSFDPPSLAGGAEHVQALEEGARTSGAIGMLEWMCWELLPNTTFQSLATFAYDKDRKAYSFNADRCDYFVTVALEPELHVLQYTNMLHSMSSYGGYLSAEQAQQRGREALVSACGLTEAQAAACTIVQTQFNTHLLRLNGLEFSGPYWYVWFNTPAGETHREFDIMIDAATGEVLYAGGPITGNG